jgi:hypothetical protein
MLVWHTLAFPPPEGQMAGYTGDLMALESTLDVALKEWDAVCRAMEQGRQLILLRKGGIHESSGEFELETPRFVMFPTFVHQSLGMLKPAEHGKLVLAAVEPAEVEIRLAGEVTGIIQLTDRKQMQAIEDAHVWTDPLIEMRFNYRPQNPLYLLLVRAYALNAPVRLANTPAYAGCKSWVPLERPLDVSNARPILDDETYAGRTSQIVQRVKSAV